MLHESGTGGAPKYGVVSQMPFVGDIGNPLAVKGGERAESDRTEVGYYRSVLTSGVEVEMAGAERAGMLRYRFPEGKGSVGVIVDVSHVLTSFRGQGLEQHYLGGEISLDRDGVSYVGFGEYDNVS
jgi:putative alpha-1,2-mannosidase